MRSENSKIIVRHTLRKISQLLGNQSYIGSHCGVTQKAVSAWKSKGQIPTKHISTLLKICKDQVTAEELLGIDKKS